MPACTPPELVEVDGFMRIGEHRHEHHSEGEGEETSCNNPYSTAVEDSSQPSLDPPRDLTDSVRYKGNAGPV